MLEKEIEQELVKKVQGLGGWCLKLISPSVSGLPDRLLLLPKGKLAFVEVKRPGQKPRLLQIKRMKQLQSFGFRVFVLDNKKGINQIIKEVIG